MPDGPDFLRRFVALIYFMRLSLKKGAHVDLSSAAWQEIGVKPFFGLSGQTKLHLGFFKSRNAPGMARKARLEHHQILCKRFHDKLRTAGHESDRAPLQG